MWLLFQSLIFEDSEGLRLDASLSTLSQALPSLRAAGGLLPESSQHYLPFQAPSRIWKKKVCSPLSQCPAGTAPTL